MSSGKVKVDDKAIMITEWQKDQKYKTQKKGRRTERDYGQTICPWVRNSAF